MYQAPDILMMAYKQPVMQDELTLLDERERHIPGSVQYAIKRYDRHPQWSLDDMGMMVYHYKKEDPGQNYLELRCCIAWNVYCRKKDIEYNPSNLNASPHCSKPATTLTVLLFHFLSLHL